MCPYNQRIATLKISLQVYHKVRQIVGPLLFDFSINDIFFFIESSSIHNFADDNTVAAWANAISDLINKLQSDSNIAIDWFKMNKIIVNPNKF